MVAGSFSWLLMLWSDGPDEFCLRMWKKFQYSCILNYYWCILYICLLHIQRKGKYSFHISKDVNCFCLLLNSLYNFVHEFSFDNLIQNLMLMFPFFMFTVALHMFIECWSFMHCLLKRPWAHAWATFNMSRVETALATSWTI